jgi:hypothetical protein
MQLQVECYTETGFIILVYWEHLNLLNREIKLIWSATSLTVRSEHKEEEHRAEEVMKDKKRRGKNSKSKKGNEKLKTKTKQMFHAISESVLFRKTIILLTSYATISFSRMAVFHRISIGLTVQTYLLRSF